MKRYVQVVAGSVVVIGAAAAILIALMNSGGTPAEKGAPPSPEQVQAPDTVHELAVIYEAELAVMHGTHSDDQASGYSGGGYVAGFDEAGDRLVFTVSAPASALYELAIGYRAPYGDKQLQLSFNGSPAGSVEIRRTDVFAETAAGKLMLREGDNELSILNGWGWYEIDYIKLKIAGKAVPRDIGKTPVDAMATDEARRLLAFLADHYGSYTLSGQQDSRNLQWLESNVGKLPAVLGLDFMDYSLSRVGYGATSRETETALDWHARGGIVTFSWHWNAPKHLINEHGKEWWRGFYTEATTFDLAYALDNKDSEDYKLLLDDIDAIAVQLNRLQQANVPVLFRPLHEAEGGWFWWGARGAEPAKQLYRVLYERLTMHHQIHNLLWVWNSVDPAWYPGDDVVDIVSYDSYPQPGDYGPVSNQYDRLAELAGNRKVVALSENGAIPDPDLLEQYGVYWSWFCTWDGDFLTDGQTNTLAHLRHVFHHDRVITLDELPDLSTYGG